MACAKGAILLVPPDHTFNHVPLSVRRLVEVLVSRLVLAGRDHRLNSTSATPAMDARVALTLVPRQAARPTAAVEQSPGHGWLQRLTLMRLAGGDVEGYDETVFVINQVDLGAKTASRTPHRMVKRLLGLRLLTSSQPPRTAPFFPPPAAALLARMTEPSMHHRSWSSWPLSSSSSKSEVTMRTQVPSRRHPLESGKHGLPWSVALGEVTPGRTGVQDPKNPVDDRAVVTWRAAHLTGAGPLRKQNRDAIPLLVRQFVAAHGRLSKIDR